MNRLLLLPALGALVGLSGCAGLGYYGDRHGGYDRYPDDHYDYGYDDYRYDRYRTSTYGRRVERDARAYANELDRYLRISNREERAVRDLLVYRTFELLERTRVRDHGRVYPFPRRPGRAVRFWRGVDREIERILDRRYHEPYAYYNRYGPDRYTDYYRYRRYDSRRGWYDVRRYEAERRAERRAAERRADRREDAREERRRAEREERREDRRRAERAQDRREEAREARRRAERAQERREDAREARRQDARDDRRAPRRDDRRADRREERRDERRDEARRDQREDRREARDRRRSDRDDRRADRDDDNDDRSRAPSRRGGNDG